MIAYNGSKEIKKAALAKLQAHADADEIIKGVYWDKGRGCAVGCLIESSDHSFYESRFGIPQMLACLEDTIFEDLPNGKAKKWPIAFMSAIKPGADLFCVGWQFLHWLLTNHNVNPGITHPLVKDAVKQCANVLAPLTKGKGVDKRVAAEYAAEYAARAARVAAEYAADLSAEYAARYAVWSAAESAKSAEYAAWSADLSADLSAAESARSAVESAKSAAWSADLSAAWSADLSAAESARDEAYVLMSKELLKLLRRAQPGTALHTAPEAHQ